MPSTHHMDDFPFDPEKIPDPDFEAPDLAGTVEGWRAWQVPVKVPPFGVSPKLHSVTYGSYYWTPRQAMIADCNSCGDDAPGENCHCGFYSAKTFDHLMGMSYHWYDAENDGMFKVVGQVANWGKVIEGSQGWRSRFSYPVQLWIPFEAWRLAKPLSTGYGVPVKLVNHLNPGMRNPVDGI